MLKRSAVILFVGSLAIQHVAKADYVLGMNFAVSSPTTISAIGVFDGGVGLTGDQTVGIFSDSSGDLVGPDVFFGPGTSGTQVGNMFYETVTRFVLAPGDYTIMGSSAGGSNPRGSGLSGGNLYQDLGNSFALPGAGRFNAGTGFALGGPSYGGIHYQPFTALDPVPDGGSAAMLLTAALAGLGWLRRKV
jgi:hypothetical protein